MSFHNLLRFGFVLSVAAFSNIAVSGQSNQPQHVKIASPNAASLGKFIDYPVNYHTGTPKISIPIYTVADGPISMPITLDYHASGLKVMEQSSWVGAGWALDAGGVITRSVRGNPDEVAASDKYYLQDRGYYSYLHIPSPPDSVLGYYYFANGQYDGEPDLFFFNCGGYSGKFYFRPDRTIVTVPQQDVKIEPRFCETGNCASNSYLHGWIVTTPDGVQYYYGKTFENPNDVDPVEYTTTHSETNGTTFIKAASSWYLYQITSADQLQTVTLSYAEEEYAYYSMAMYPISNLQGESGINLVKNLVYGVRLTAITFANGSVSFVANTTDREDLSSTIASPTFLDNTNGTFPNGGKNAKSLKQIVIASNNLNTTFELTHGYFVDNTNVLKGSFASKESMFNLHSDKKRLKLVSLQERSTDGSLIKPAYVFSYFDEASVPRTLSLAQDHWGFYNGADNNSELIPSLSTDGGVHLNAGRGAERESSWPEMRAGALSKIQYPTGGFTEFEFESHENGYLREYYTYEKSTQKYNGSAGFMGADYSSPVVQVTVLTPAKYLVEMDGTNLLTGSGGQLHIGSYVYSISPGQTSSELIDLPAGTYNTYVSVSSPISTGHGVMGKLFETTPVQHIEYPLIGGLRVKNMKHNDGKGDHDLITTFDYENNLGESQGVLYSRPNYIALAKNDIMRQSGIASGGNEEHEFEGYETTGCILFPVFAMPYFTSPSSVHPMKTSQGNHIGYNQVKVTQADGGYMIYKFKTAQNATGDVSVKSIDISQCDILAPNFPPAPEPFEFSRGELRKESLYSAAGALLKETNYLDEYTFDSVGVTGLIVVRHGEINMPTEYELKSAKKTKTTTLEWTYPAANGLPLRGTITETFFDSPNHGFPTRSVMSEATAPNVSSTEIATVIKGMQLLDERNTYVADIVIPSCTPANTIDQTLISKLTQHLNTYNATLGGCPVQAGPARFTCRFNAWQTYIKSVNWSRKTHVLNRGNYVAAQKSCNGSATTYSAAGTDLKALIDLKLHHNIDGVIENSNWRDGKFLNSSFLTYQMFESNRDRVYPGKFEVIQTATPLVSTTFAPMTNSNSTITKDSDYKQEEVFAFKNGNMSEIIGINGIKTSYQWGYNNQHPVVLITNASTLQVFYQSFETAAGTIGDSKTGERYLNSANYVIPFTPPADGAVYKMSYWYWSSNKWNFSGELPFSSTINSGGTRLDEVRVYPLGAQLTTYTYQTGMGVSSITDPNNKTVYFEYDKLGRLITERDSDNNIVKSTTYHFKN